MQKAPAGMKDSWRRGENAYFEYHCDQSKSSCDYPAYQHSHQIVKVLKVAARGFGNTIHERVKSGEILVYRVRFSDGLEWDVFEDELLTSPRYYSKQFDPPEDLG